jgi:hypothetical protein
MPTEAFCCPNCCTAPTLAASGVAHLPVCITAGSCCAQGTAGLLLGTLPAAATRLFQQATHLGPHSPSTLQNTPHPGPSPAAVLSAAQRPHALSSTPQYAEQSLAQQCCADQRQCCQQGTDPLCTVIDVFHDPGTT